MSSVVTTSRGWRRRGPSILRAAGILALPLMLAGCSAGKAPAATLVSHQGVAQRLLQELVLPAKAGVLTPGAGGVPTSFQSDDAGCAGVVQQEQYWQVPGLSISAAQAWFEHHAPSDLRLAGTGSGGDRSGETMTEVDYTAGPGGHVRAGSRLVVEAVPNGAGSVIRASAQIAPAKGCGPVHYYSGLPS